MKKNQGIERKDIRDPKRTCRTRQTNLGIAGNIEFDYRYGSSWTEST